MKRRCPRGCAPGALAGLGDLIHSNARRPKTVFRYQNKCGLGPYQLDDDFDELAEREAARSGRAPAPDDDFPKADLKFLHPRPSERAKAPTLHFGFEKPSDASRWFGPRARAWLHAHGFALVPVRATKVWRGGHQVMFVAKPGARNTPTSFPRLREKLERAKCGTRPPRRRSYNENEREKKYRRCVAAVQDALEQDCLPRK